MSKGGLHTLTVALASELAVHDIRVNMAAPEFVRTNRDRNVSSMWTRLVRT